MIKFKKGDVVQIRGEEKLYMIEKVFDKYAVLIGGKDVLISSLIKISIPKCQCGMEPCNSILF
jgi:hypothetical protein